MVLVKCRLLDVALGYDEIFSACVDEVNNCSGLNLRSIGLLKVKRGHS